MRVRAARSRSKTRADYEIKRETRSGYLRMLRRAIETGAIVIARTDAERHSVIRRMCGEKARAR